MRDRVLELRQGDAKTELGRDVGKRVAGGLRGQSRAPGETGIDLYDVVLGG